MIGRDHADGNDVVSAGDDGSGGHCDHRIEVAGGEGVAEVAQIVGEERLQQGKVGAQAGLQEIGLAVDLDALLAVLDRRAVSNYSSAHRLLRGIAIRSRWCDLPRSRVREALASVRPEVQVAKSPRRARRLYTLSRFAALR